MNISRISNINALGIRFGLVVKKGQGQLRFIIYANLVGNIPNDTLQRKKDGKDQETIQSSPKNIDLLVPEKNILKVFFTLYGHNGHLGHVTINVCYEIYSPLFKESPYEI